jgi:hypothetical protein
VLLGLNHSYPTLMTQARQPSSSLLRLLEDASIAAEEFGTAFKDAWQLKLQTQDDTQPSWQSVLGERELKQWREAFNGKYTLFIVIDASISIYFSRKASRPTLAHFPFSLALKVSPRQFPRTPTLTLFRVMLLALSLQSI